MIDGKEPKTTTSIAPRTGPEGEGVLRRADRLPADLSL